MTEIYNPFSLEGKTILVTGASSGIGKSIAIECSRMGANVIITARNETRLQDTLSKMEKGNHQIFIANLEVEDEIDSLINSIPVLHGIVHSAGIAMPVPFNFISREKIKNIFDINYCSPILLSQKALKAKKIIKGGSIVFVSSISGVICSYVGGTLYSSTKGAINGAIKGMAIELASKKIRVNSVVPGMINTNILENGEIAQEQLEADKKNYPLGRYGEPEDVAHAVIYLLSDASQWVTGSNLLIDGGYTLL